MSGGSYDHSYHRIYDFAESCILPNRDYDTGVTSLKDNFDLRKQFSEHLKKVAECMRIIEWADGGDMGPDDVKKCLEEFFE